MKTRWRASKDPMTRPTRSAEHSRRSGLACARAACALAVLATATPALAQEADPWEGFNRSIYDFNEWLDLSVLIPIAKGWDFVVPEPVQTSVQNVFETLNMVVVFGNDVLQLKPAAAGHDLARVLVNVTVGIGGIFDVASKISIDENDEDFGQTLGYWGVRPGPFLMLPFFGPSNPRDAVGLAVDYASNPVSYVAPFYVTVPMTGVSIVNLRSLFLEEIDELREASLDYYSFQHNAFVQSRELAIADRDAIEGEDEDELYYFDEDEDPE
jgi:phospholipid-binding lipoprotein MlaA